MTDIYSKEFVELIDRWQEKGSGKGKVKIGAELKQQAASIDDKYKTCNVKCYRQYGFQKDLVYKIHTDLEFTEKISSWTIDLNCAKEFKNGIPGKDGGYYGFIFEIFPKPEQIILNLNELYADPLFINACKKYAGSIPGGIGKYGNSQKEIILEVEKVNVNMITAYAGHNTDLRKLVESQFGPVSDAKFLELSANFPPNILKGEGAWIVGKAKDRVLKRLIEQGKQYK